MLDRVRAEESLRELNATLEQRVTARTAELERSNRDLDQFVYSASHDLKSPLRRRAQRMDRLLEDLLVYAHIGRSTGRLEEVDTGDLVRSIGAELDLPAGFVVAVEYHGGTIHVTSSAAHGATFVFTWPR